MNDLIKNFKKRNIEAVWFETKEEATEQLLKEFEDGNMIAWGGSMTLNELGLKEKLIERNLTILDRDNVKSSEEKRAMQIASFDSDYYLMSSNAITKGGELINIDGSGNRLAAMLYGPRKVYVIVGKNKICKTEKEAIDRVKNYVAPRNALRLGFNTPCVKTEMCYNCLNEQCICNHMVITRRSWEDGRIKVVIINENLGI